MTLVANLFSLWTFYLGWVPDEDRILKFNMHPKQNVNHYIEANQYKNICII